MSWLLSILPLLEHYSIVVMMLLFIALVARAYWPSRRAELEAQGRIPLQDDV